MLLVVKECLGFVKISTLYTYLYAKKFTALAISTQSLHNNIVRALRIQQHFG